MTHHGRTRKRYARLLAAASALVLVLAPISASASTQYHFDPAVYDITATPNGGIALAQNGSVLIARDGEVRHVADVPLEPSNPAVNGLEAIGNGSFLATTAAGDLAIGGKLWHVTPAGARLMADIGAFERAHDPDAFSGLQWKDQRCEEVDGFSAGPQTNPYHLAARSASEALVADAAGNTLLSAGMNGRVDWVAIFTPPVADGSASDDPDDWMVRFHLGDGTPCYVQPVPTSVAVGPDGATYVGELTGTTAAVFDAPGLSRIWRIAPGAHNVVCPSAVCEMVLGGLTSVIDIEFGPDGLLYVVEYDKAGWLPALIGFPQGGTVKACDVGAGICRTPAVADGLVLPGAITFDKDGKLWLLESNIVSPTIRPLSTP